MAEACGSQRRLNGKGLSGSPMTTLPSCNVICTKCGEAKHASEFHRQRNRKHGHHSWCKTCYNLYARTIRNKRVAPKTRRGWNLSTRYNLTHADVEKMLADQGSLCGICAEALPERYHIDHCHSTGKVRGILCHRCNLKLTMVEDEKLLASALAYLARSRS